METVLLTGATGYVGGRLLKRLLADQNYLVRCLVRRREVLKYLSNSPRLEIVVGDALNSESLSLAMQGVSTAYYLVHSMGVKTGFAKLEEQGAKIFAESASNSGLKRIIYLGGLYGSNSISTHLASRKRVGEILRSGKVPCIEFQASVVIGSGSISFEIMRALCERLPIMTPPLWVKSLAQPISIEDLVDYLVEALEHPKGESVLYEIGGSEIVSYFDMMLEYCRQRGLKRRIICVPLLTPRLSSLWLGLVTPVYARIGRRLIESLNTDTIIKNQSALKVFKIRPMSVKTAISRALQNEDEEFAATRWCSSESSNGIFEAFTPTNQGVKLFLNRNIDIPAEPSDVFQLVESLGGKKGWLYLNIVWQIRGWIDQLIGGVGIQRGRLDPHHLRVGQAVDFWRVEEVDRPKLIKLKAEMKLPGRGWLQFEVEPISDGSRLTLIAIFDPRGVLGLVYWYLLYIPHLILLTGLVRSIKQEVINVTKPSSTTINSFT